MARYPFLKYL